MTNTFTPVSGYDQVSYAGPSVTASDVQKLCLFHPNRAFARPKAGWPCVVWIEMGGFRFTNLLTSIGPFGLYVNPSTPDTDDSFPRERFLHRALMRGWAVITCAVTPTYSAGLSNGTTSGQTASTDIAYVIGKVASDYLFGNAPDGNGVAIPYAGGTFPTGYQDALGRTEADGAIHPFQDVARHNCFMDSEMIAQFIHANYADMGIDINRIIGAGDSAGADVSCWCAWGPDRGPTRWLNPSGQEKLSTQIYRGAFYKTWQPYFNMVTDAYTVPPGPCRHANTGSHILANHYDTPGLSILDISRDDVIAFDPMTYLDATMATQNYCFTYMTDDDTNTVGNWNTPTAQAIGGINPHDSYGVGLWKQALGARCAYYMNSTTYNANCNEDASIVTASASNGYAKLHDTALALFESDLVVAKSSAFVPRYSRRALL